MQNQIISMSNANQIITVQLNTVISGWVLYVLVNKRFVLTD